MGTTFAAIWLPNAIGRQINPKPPKGLNLLRDIIFLLRLAAAPECGQKSRSLPGGCGGISSCSILRHYNK
jgi:hypothetical protein